MKRIVHFFLFLVLLAGVASCKSRGKAATVTGEPSAAAVLTEKQRLDFDYLYFDALKDKMLGNYALAQNKLQQALRIDPRNAAAHFELSQVYALSGSVDQAEQSGQLAVRFAQNNEWYKLSLAELYERAGKFGPMVRLLEELVKAHPQKEEYLLGLATGYVQVGRYDDAIKICDKLETIGGVNEELALQKRNLYMQMKKPDKALNEIQKLIKAFPGEPGYRAYLADIYLETNQPQKALEQYQEILRLDPQNPDVHYSLAEYYRNQGDKERSFEELKQAFSNPEGLVEQKLQVLGSYFELTRYFPELKSQAQALCEILAAQHPEDPRAHAVYGDFLLREEKFEEALQQYLLVLETDKSRFSVWNQVLMIYSELKRSQEMYDLSKEAIELFPTQPTLYLYNGIAAMQLKRYEDAVGVMKEGLAVTTGNDALTAQFYASLGDSYNFLSRYRESSEAYEKALKIDADNTYVLNNYAYYLSLRKENLERAKELAARCNELAPGNPSYQDTYAWVLYQAGDIENAASWIDKAIASGGIRNATIMEHKGDILWKQGKASDALDFWHRAKELGGNGTYLEAKLEQKKLVE